MASSLVAVSSTPATVSSSVPKFHGCKHGNRVRLPLAAPPHSRRYKRLVGVMTPKASYSCGLWTPENSNSRSGIWSIRDDLEIPSSPYFPVIAQEKKGPSPAMQEKLHILVSQLFQHRIIRCGGSFDDDMANIIVAQLLYLDAVDPNKDIVILINSPGGSVTAGMAIFDTIRHIRPAVSTVCVGLAASMAAFLLSSGTKGKRYSLSNSRIMIHQPLGEIHGQNDDTQLQVLEILHHWHTLNAYLSYNTGQNIDRITEDVCLDFFMSAQEAMDYGLIDGVITSPMEALHMLPAVKV